MTFPEYAAIELIYEHPRVVHITDDPASLHTIPPPVVAQYRHRSAVAEIGKVHCLAIGQCFYGHAAFRVAPTTCESLRDIQAHCSPACWRRIARLRNGRG